MNGNKRIYRSLMLLCFTLLSPIVYAAEILDKIEIIQTNTEADIHIDFFTQVRYLRHSPTNESSSLQIFLDFPQLTVAPTQRE
ncbi:MAG: hypothetical protein RLZZ349_853, partial [Pseudomonadota bacterium]